MICPGFILKIRDFRKFIEDIKIVISSDQLQ